MTPARKTNQSTKGKKRATNIKIAVPRSKASVSKASAKGASKAKSKTDQLPDLAPKRIEEILSRLDKSYPQARCALHHHTAWELLVATILSAQCTDVRVNIVTPELFRLFPTPEAMSTASLPELETLVRTTGFFRNKAKNILAAAKRVVNDFGGQVPADMEQLLSLPGVARKTANVVLGSWFEIAEGVVVDTHVLRISHRLGLTKATTPEKVEQDLVRILPKNHWIDYSHQIIYLGRQICIARKPRCADCFLEDLCHSRDKTWSTHS